MNETPEQVMRWFHAGAEACPCCGRLSVLRKSPCIRENCAACASGEGHSSHVLYGRRDGKRFSIYIPEEIVPEVREAIANGRLIQEVIRGWRSLYGSPEIQTREGVRP